MAVHWIEFKYKGAEAVRMAVSAPLVQTTNAAESRTPELFPDHFGQDYAPLHDARLTLKQPALETMEDGEGLCGLAFV
jgi:hypothetical protein